MVKAAVSVPELVTGELVTVNCTGIANPTEVTVPVVGVVQVGTPAPALVNTWPDVPAAVNA